MTYILPKDIFGGKIIGHSLLMEYDPCRLVESYDLDDEIFPPTPELNRIRTFSRPENDVPESAELVVTIEKYLFVDAVLKIHEDYRKDVLGATFPLPYAQQPLALLCSIEDVELVYTAQSYVTGYQLQLSPLSIEAIESFQDETYCRELGLREEELPTNLDQIMSLFSQLEIPIGCLHKLKSLKNYNIYFLIDDSCSMITAPSPYLASSDAHEILLSRRSVSDPSHLTYWEYCESLLHNFMDILCYVPMKSIKISFVNEIDCGIRLDRREKKINPKRFQDKFRQKIAKSFETVRKRCLKTDEGGGRNHREMKLFEIMEKLLSAAVQTSTDPTLFIVLSSGELTDRSPSDLKALISQRQFAERLPINFLPIGDPVKSAWMREVRIPLFSPFLASSSVHSLP